MPPESPCQQHPNARAGWSCDACGSTLCLRCAYRRRAGQGWLIVCGHCGSMASPIMVSRAVRSFPALIPGAFLYPFSVNGFVTMAMAGVVLGVLAMLGGNASMLAAGVFVSYLFLVIRTTASGYGDLPEAEDFSHVADLAGALFRLMLAMGVSGLPLFVYVVYFKTTSGLLSYFTDPWVYVTLLLGVLWGPMACMQAATNSPLLAIINPVFAAGYISRIPGDYAVAAATFWVLAGGSFLVNLLGNGLAGIVPIPVVPSLYATAVATYLPIVLARVLGLLLLSRGAELGYGAPRDYVEPALGDALPPIEPAAVVAPIETVTDVTKGFQSFSAMEGTGFQTMADPQSLPQGTVVQPQPIESSPAQTSATPPTAPEEGLPSAIEAGLAARAQAAALPIPASEQATDQQIRAMATAGRFDFVAAAYRDRLGVVDVLSAEELRLTAESAAAGGDLETATHALRRLAHDFPGSPLTPAALLNAGVLLMQELGQPQEGQALIEYLVSAYAQSPAAEQGRHLLKAGR